MSRLSPLGISASRHLGSNVKRKILKSKYITLIGVSVSVFALNVFSVNAESSPISWDNKKNIYFNGNGSYTFSDKNSPFFISNTKNIFSGQVTGPDPFDMTAFPIEPDVNPFVDPGAQKMQDFLVNAQNVANTATGISINSASVELNGASIKNMGILALGAGQPGSGSYPDGKNYNPNGMTNALIYNGSQIDVGEFVAGSNNTSVANMTNSDEKQHDARVIVSDASTQIKAGQVVLGQEVGYSEDDRPSALKDPASHGTMWVTNGSKIDISGGGANGGLYLGNLAGLGPDGRGQIEYTIDGKPYMPKELDPDSGRAIGVLHITGNNISFNGGQSAR